MLYLITACAVIVGVIAIMTIWKWKTPQRAALPNLATILGVLGTFVGILIGLFNFNVGDIEGSIPGLLNGLQFAFFTSVTGISIAIILRFLIVPIGQTQGTTLDNLAEILEDGFEKANANAKALTEAVNNIQQINDNAAAVAHATLLSKIDSVERVLVNVLRKGFEKADANAATLAEAVNKFQQTNEHTASDARAVTEEGNSMLLNRIDSMERALVGEGESTLADILRNGFEQTNANTATLAEAVSSIQQINENTAAAARAVTEESNSTLLNRIESVEQALVGEGESTLAGILRNGFEQTNANAAVLDEAVSSIQQINENTAAVARAITDEGESTLLNKIESVERALVGEGESTLLTQMQKMGATFSDKQDEMRTTFTNKQDELIGEFKQFAGNSSKELVQALQEVIAKFNVLISDQIGDNFKHLNEAVGQLLIWQENYKEQVEAMVGQLRQSMEALEMCEEAMIVVTERSEAFAGVADRLEETLGDLSGRNEEMNAHLEALAGLGERAESAFPAIQRNIAQITDGLTTTANGFAESADAALKTMENQRTLIEKSQAEVNEQLKASLEEQQKLMADHQKRVSGEIYAAASKFGVAASSALLSMDSQRKSIIETQNKVNAQIEKAVGDFKTAVDASLESMSEQRGLIEENQEAVNDKIQETADAFESAAKDALDSISRIVRNTGESLRRQTIELDRKIREEAANSLNTLADQLASLSGKFVEDYSPLTDKLRAVVRMAENLDGRSSNANRGLER